MLQKAAIEPDALELLKALQADSMFSDFHLAGGTGLALQLGHRLSIDLDLFSEKSFDQEVYLQYLEKNYNFQLDFRATNTLKGIIGKVKVDLITHSYIVLKPLVFAENIRIYSKEDIAAMKVNAIAGNGTRSKDFVDLYFLLKEFSVKEVLGFFKKKYAQRDEFHVLKSLNYFDEVNLADWPELLLEKKTKWEKVKESINKYCAQYSKDL